MTENLYTRGQLERKISQEIQSFYHDYLGHRPSRVTCQIFDAKLAIILEDSFTKVEKILIDEGKIDLAGNVRSTLDNAIQSQLRQLIEKFTEVEIVDFLSDFTVSTGRTGIITVLSDTPQVRNPNSIPKIKNI